MTLTIRAVTSNAQTASYDASTKWASRYHGDKTVNTLDAAEVKDGDYVICRGSYGDKGEFHATAISKRLSHSRSRVMAGAGQPQGLSPVVFI